MITRFEKETDEKLMKMYVDGNYDAFEALYKRHSSRIYGYLNQRLSSTQEVNDLFQEVFTKLHNYRSKYNSKYRFLPWIFTITRNTLIDFYRKQGKSVFESREMDNFAANDCEKKSDLSIEEVPGMASLKKREKEIIKMRYEEDRDFREIARIFETSESNIRKIISRGVAKLRTFMTGIKLWILI